jgi:ATP-dependent Clp protease ATP-binding subunit ClpA
MFERFTDRARRVVVLAQEEARHLGHNWIGTEHILLGLISDREGVASKVLEDLGISLGAVRAEVELIIGQGDKRPGSHIPFTPRAKKVLELSLREALQLGHNYIGTEHILLGLIREGEGVGAQVLVKLGADLSVVRQGVIQQLGGYTGRRRGGGAPGAMFQPPRHETPAVTRGAVEARRLAGGSPVGSHHYLLGLLAAEDSLAAKALAELGVSRQALEQKLTELDPAGTSDETPEEAGARRIRMRVEGKVLTLEVDDPELATSLEQAMVGRKVRIISGTDPEAEGFPNLWAAVSRTVEDMTRRLGRVTGTRATGTSPSGPGGEWRPPGWHPEGHAGVYWIVNTADGMSGTLEVSGTTDREALQDWLRAWLISNQATLGMPNREQASCCSLWAYLDAAGDSFTITSFGFGAEGPPGCQPVTLDTLIEAAVAELARAAAATTVWRRPVSTS